eukprot:302323-Lingulodinium_polyedra.AAC.1
MAHCHSFGMEPRPHRGKTCTGARPRKHRRVPHGQQQCEGSAASEQAGGTTLQTRRLDPRPCPDMG